MAPIRWFRSRARSRLRSEKGQTMTEYMLVIAVLVIGIVAVTYTPMKNAAVNGSNGFTKTFDDVSKAGGVGLDDGDPTR